MRTQPLTPQATTSCDQFSCPTSSKVLSSQFAYITFSRESGILLEYFCDLAFVYSLSMRSAACGIYVLSRDHKDMSSHSSVIRHLAVTAAS